VNILRTYSSIIDNSWGGAQDGDFIFNTSSPVPYHTGYEWNYSNNVSLKDIQLWEQLYHEPGVLGLYAAWTPYIECYLLIQYPFVHSTKGVKLFYGSNACYEVANIMQKLDVSFEVKKIAVPTAAI